MSDLAATNCGCGCERDCDCGNMSNFFGNNGCSCIIWIILILALCGNGSGFGNNGCNNNGGCDSCLWIILILFFCCGNNNGCC